VTRLLYRIHSKDDLNSNFRTLRKPDYNTRLASINGRSLYAIRKHFTNFATFAESRDNFCVLEQHMIGIHRCFLGQLLHLAQSFLLCTKRNRAQDNVPDDFKPSAYW